ncbi:MAG: alpha/beta fold hydrolase [Myxococcaceae bacterium]|nr:alpha/beta fold hydrolase [Myxococcaceae bacterium]
MRVSEREVIIPIDGVRLYGTLAEVPDARAAVVFAHGSGSGRHSGRNRYVATELQLAGFSTLLFDMLTEDEEEAERDGQHLRFDVDLLAMRLTTASQWLARRLGDEPSIGYFGASTGAAAALVAAARAPEHIDAIVSRGGRPDLAGPELEKVHAPTLLVVGSEDRAVLDMNERALEHLDARAALEVVEGATHLFEEPGALEVVAALSRQWFGQHLRLQPALHDSPGFEAQP